MGKGGDQTTTSSTSEPSEFLKPYLTDLLSKAKTVSNQPYTTYKDPRLAGFSSDTNRAFDMIRTQAAGGGGIDAVDNGINAATGIAGYRANPITSKNVSTNNFNFKGIPQANLQAYMDPYEKNVLDVQKKRATQAFQEQQAGRDAGAVSAGAFGGDRRFVSDSLARRDLNDQLQGIDATGLSNAYNNATNLFETDEGRRLSAFDADAGRRLTADTGNADRGLQAAMASEQFRQSGGRLGLDAASLLGQLGQTRNDLGLQNAEALSGVGAKIQQQKQAGLDLAHQDFIDQRDWPAKQLQLYSQLLSGNPVTPSTSTTTTGPAPDFLSQLAGLGISGAGLWKLLQGTA